MKLYNFVRGYAVQPREVLQIRPEFAAVADCNFTQPWCGQLHFFDVPQPLANGRFDRVVIGCSQIKFDQDRRVSGLKIDDARNRVRGDLFEKFRDLLVRRLRNTVAEIQKNALIARWLESYFERFCVAWHFPRKYIAP